MTKNSAAKNTTWKWFSKYTRTRDCLRTMNSLEYGRCISCNAVVKLEEADAGHFIPGRKDAYLFEETNCHLQCARCNRFLQGAWVEYEQAMLKLYGQAEVDRLKALKFAVVKFNDADYKALATKYRLKYKELLNG